VPCAPKNIEAVKAITLVEEKGGYALHAKTGWCTSVKPSIGWWVGWVEHENRAIAAFALNIDMPAKEDAMKRIELGRACLAELGVLPAERIVK
jgi:beta-lactamase class D